MVAKLRLPRSPADEAMRTTAEFGGYTYATSRPPLSTFDAMMAAKLGYKGDAPGGAAFDFTYKARALPAQMDELGRLLDLRALFQVAEGEKDRRWGRVKEDLSLIHI